MFLKKVFKKVFKKRKPLASFDLKNDLKNDLAKKNILQSIGIACLKKSKRV